jgi:hypothetical protein
VHVKGGVRGAKFAEHFAVEPDEASFVFPYLSQNDMIEALKAKPVLVRTRNLGRSNQNFLALRTNSIVAIARNVCACGESDNAPISTARNVEKTFVMFAAEPDVLATC